MSKPHICMIHRHGGGMGRGGKGGKTGTTNNRNNKIFKRKNLYV